MRQAFITKALNHYNERIVTQMRAVAKRAGIGVTNEGIQSLAYQTVAAGQGAASKLSFKEYLRMVDMGAGRGHPLGGLKNTLVTLQSSNKSGFAQTKDNTRKPKTFLYSRIAYGNLTGLQNELLYGYSEEAIALLKQELQSPGSTN
jgi:hypothetical protein